MTIKIFVIWNMTIYIQMKQVTILFRWFPRTTFVYETMIALAIASFSSYTRWLWIHNRSKSLMTPTYHVVCIIKRYFQIKWNDLIKVTFITWIEWRCYCFNNIWIFFVTIIFFDDTLWYLCYFKRITIWRWNHMTINCLTLKFVCNYICDNKWLKKYKNWIKEWMKSCVRN